MILAPFGMLGMQVVESTEIPEVIKLLPSRLGGNHAVGIALVIRWSPISVECRRFIVSYDEVVQKLWTLLETTART